MQGGSTGGDEGVVGRWFEGAACEDDEQVEGRMKSVGMAGRRVGTKAVGEMIGVALKGD